MSAGFSFSRNHLNAKEERLQRVCEILPGCMSWTILLGMIALSIYKPLIAAVIIIAFYLYWIMRLFYLTIFLVLSYFRLSIEKKTDWMKRVCGMDNLEEYARSIKGVEGKEDLRKKISRVIHYLEVEKIRRLEKKTPRSDELYHVVIIPIAKEQREIVEPGIKSLAKSIFPTNRMLVVLALEERATTEVKRGAEEIHDSYKKCFLDLIVVPHPDGIIGEARVKGANATYAAKRAAEFFEKRNIPFENVICSCFDADTVVNPEYFAALTYYFLTCPNRKLASFQPVPVYNNNIWEAPGITRVLEVGSSFFQLVEATNPEQLVTFSSHSMSFKALVDVGYWPVDMISDDSAIFWKAFIHYDGNYRVVPMYTMLSMDAVVGNDWWDTVKKVYKQKRRWAWGVENFPIVTRAFLQNNRISLVKRFRNGFKLFEGHVSWATWSFILTIIGWLPAIFATKDYSQSVMYYSTPRIARIIFNCASISLLTSIFLSLRLLPKGREHGGFLKKLGFAMQWLLIPLTIVSLSALPALDAQTRLMFGRYMTFWVTDKKRK
ncbi:MAG: glycosyltransferase family 2 protein [Candidatus Omnitrophica bacterium]|nr:glycosyltransferase family 2 protein [Candidatus Omnitrophota bacterium]